jgi:hypothetical protein
VVVEKVVEGVAINSRRVVVRRVMVSRIWVSRAEEVARRERILE